eukprot:6703667-Prorocentrum_lima.AAC.1
MCIRDRPERHGGEFSRAGQLLRRDSGTVRADWHLCPRIGVGPSRDLYPRRNQWPSYRFWQETWRRCSCA